MNTERKSRRLIRLAAVSALILAAVLVVLCWKTKTYAQNSAQGHSPVHMTTDWSNRHMVYSSPSWMGQALRLQQEPRYLHQLMRRAAPASQQPVQ